MNESEWKRHCIVHVGLCVIAFISLTACGGKSAIKNLDANESSAVIPSVSIEKQISEKSRVMATVEQVSGDDDYALQLFSARPASTSFISYPERPESRFQYEDIVLTGHPLEADESDSRTFAAEFTYNAIRGGIIHAPFGDNRVRFEMGVLLEVGELSLSAAEVHSTHRENFNLSRTDASLGVMVGMNWRIAGPLQMKLYRERLFAPGQDVQSSRLGLDLEYSVTPSIRLQYGFRGYTQEDDGEVSSIDVSASGHHIGIVFSL